MNIRLIEKWIYKFSSILGVNACFQLCRPKHKVCILLYHDLEPEAFRSQLQFLRKKKYNFISLEEYTQVLYQSTKSTLPDRSVIITFDDGHKGNYALLSILKEFKIKPVIYLCSDIIATQRMYWFQWIQDTGLKAKLKRVANDDRISRLEALGFNPLEEQNERSALSLLEIKEMQAHVDFQSHTRFHPILPKCTNEDAWNEIEQSKALLEERFNTTIQSIAYPNGNYGAREIEYIKSAGYLTGMTVEPGLNSLRANPFRLKRYAIKDATHTYELESKLSGVADVLYRLRRIVLKTH
jgi:peptidoglycan/xylan/chitin deacetylase (PgdA/CDA1 family)